MNEAEVFLEGCTARGRMTLSDHLSLAGYNDVSKRRSVSTQVNALLLEQRFKNLIGAVITHDQDARGISPRWAKDAPRQKNKVERNLTTTALQSQGLIKAMDLIRNPDSRNELQAVLARQSNRASRIVTSAIETIAREGDFDRREKELALDALKDARENSEALRRALYALADDKKNAIVA